jgi:hypothetical protein
MTSQIDIANRALSRIGTQKTIANFTDPTPAATQCGLWYDQVRQALLRTAPWAFARRQQPLTQTGDAVPDNTAPFPWMYQYAYPADCLKFRYVLPSAPASTASAPNVSDTSWTQWQQPNRAHRYMLDTIFDAESNPSRILVSNVPNAIGCYTYDCTVPDMFDPLFTRALVEALAAELVMPLSGNVGLVRELQAAVELKITQARAADGNESITRIDHTADWIAARNGYCYNSPFGDPLSSWGNYTCAYDDMSWSM